MKKRLLFFVVVIATVSCLKESREQFSESIEMVFTASNADCKTKTSRLEDGKLLWSPREEINVFFGENAKGYFVSTNTDPAAVVDFRGTIEISTVNNNETFPYWAVYPYSEGNSFENDAVILSHPCVQTSPEGTIGDGMFPSVARSNSFSLPFYNVCGGLKFSLSRQDISSITLEGNNGESLAGKIKVSFSDGVPMATVLEGEKKITLVPGGSGTFVKGSNYYFTIVPVELSSGFKMTFHTMDGKMGILSTPTSTTIKRNVFAKKENIDSYVSNWEDDPSPSFNKPGLYLGIAGFNQGLYTMPITLAKYTNKDSFDNFIDSMTANNGTMLYYAVDHSLDVLQKTSFPNELANVAVVTFTDGLDQGSIMYNPKYATDDDYLTAINSRLKNEKVSGIDISAYSIGLRGSDVKDVQKFQNGLKKLASCDENAFEATDMSQVEARFKEIAKIASAYPCYNLAFTIPGQATGTKIRFTLDNVSSATSSNLYIEGTFNLAARSLESVTYYGFKESSETTIKGKVDGIFVTFEFKGLSKMDESELKLDYVKQWSCSPSSFTWQINSEFSKEDASMSISTRTAAVFLILDCSSSLGDKFSSMQTCAHSFVSSLYDVLKFTEVEKVSLSKTTMELWSGLSYKLNGNVLPSIAIDTSLSWASSDSSIATVNSEGVVVGKKVGECSITATASNGVYAQCKVSVISINEMVDLGLSVKWRSMNIGATKPEEYGRYFVWGDVVGQTWDGSKWSGNGFSSTPSYELDSKYNLKPAYDAAHVLLGGTWRMPTRAEQSELYTNCTSTWTNVNGVSGILFTSKKTGYTDKSIFLPAAGYGNHSGLYKDGYYGSYWSSTCYPYNDCAYTFKYCSDGSFSDITYCFEGRSVRPVTK